MALAVFTVLLVVGAPPALADYLERSAFSGPSELEAPRRVAVEQSTGNVFVVNSAKDRVSVFKPEGTSGALLTEFGTGELDAPFGIAIEESGGQTEIYVSDAGNDRIVRYLSDEQPTPAFTLDGSYSSPALGPESDEIQSFESPLALAPNGDLWVADRGANVVKRFDASGAHVDGSNIDGTSTPGGAFTGLLDLAVSAGGDLYVLDTTGDVSQQLGNSRVERLAADGTHKATLNSPDARAAMVAVNPSDGTVAISGKQDAVYADATPTVNFFDAANGPLYERTLIGSQFSTVQGLAFRDAARDLLYAVADVGVWGGAPYGSPALHTFEDAAMPVVTIDPVNPASITAGGATVTGTVNPEGEPTEWQFQYKASGATDWLSTPLEDAGSGAAPVPASAELEDLKPGTEYAVRLFATGPNGSRTSPEQAFTTEAEAPVIGAIWARAQADTATLLASIDPRGATTTYTFEYGPTGAYGRETDPATVTAGPSSVSIEGLEPETTYHFRVIAENSEGEAVSTDRTFTTSAVPPACANEQLRTGLAAELSDCRAYELVTPVGAHADIRIGGGPASPDGSTVCFNSEDSMVGSTPNGMKVADDGFCAWREGDGWRTEWVSGPTPERLGAQQGANVYFLSADGTRAVVASDLAPFGNEFVPKSPSTASGPSSTYLWEDGETWWSSPPPLDPKDPTQFASEGRNRVSMESSGAFEREHGLFLGRKAVAASEDVRRGIFESDLPLVPEDENIEVDAYEWHPGGIRVISTTPDGKAAGVGRMPLTAPEQTIAPGAVSADGSRVFFLVEGEAQLDPDSPAPEGIGVRSGIQSVYMREGDELTHISPRLGPGPPANVDFVGASLDGELAYMETEEQLTPEAKQAGLAIYEYDVSAEELALFADAPGGVQFLAVSADGSTVLYRERGSETLMLARGGDLTELGTLGSSDTAPYRVASKRIDQRSLRISPDGSVAVFAASGDFADIPAGGPVQIYRWADGEGVERISGEIGSVPTKNASIGAYASNTLEDPREEFLYVHRIYGAFGRVMSDDGSRVFFETTEPLVGRDVNGVTDVYEWHEGEIDLITSGTGGKSFYHESSADGETVFFTTFNRLLPEVDLNNNRDVYAARTGGGFVPPPLPPPPCKAEACQRPNGPPALASPGVGADAGNFGVGPKVAIGKAQRKQLVNKGKTTVKVTVSAPGRVTALLRARLGGRDSVVSRASKVAAQPGVVSLKLKLSKKAKTKLARSGKLALTLEVEQSGQAVRKGVMLRD